MHKNNTTNNIKNNIKKRNYFFGRFPLLMITMAIIAVIFLSAVSVISVRADDTPDNEKTYRYYTSILIYPGDTLESIAVQYTDGSAGGIKDFKDSVYFTNHMTDDKIIPGDYLIVPYYSNEYK